MTIDQPLGSLHPEHGFAYPVNYGFLAGIVAPDGDYLDAYYLGADQPLQTAEGVCLAIAHRRDDDDDKLIVAPAGVELSDESILAAIRFQEQWFDTVLVR